MIVNETQANLDTMTCIMFIFGIPARVLFDFGSNRSFVSTTFALYADRDLALLKNKLMVTTPFGE